MNRFLKGAKIKLMREKNRIKKQILEAIQNEPLKSAVKKAALFGSYLKGEQREDSDVDILVELEPNARIGLFKFAEMQEALSQYLGRRVDLLTFEGLSKYIRDQVLEEAETIYER